jgi:phosphoribosylformimino-5-aminoimidazole carboxamide ribotide isomerase
MKIIPAIDLQNGQCVRLRQGNFDDNTIYPQSPQVQIKTYSDRGAKHIHIVDLDGARCGEIQQLSLIQSMLSDNVSLQVGGGIRSLETARTCLDAGINQLVIGSLAISNPDLTQDIIKTLGAGRIVLALDVNIVNSTPFPAIHGWQTASMSCLWDVADSYEKFGITNILCTDIACDGMMNGPNLALYEEAVNRFPNIDWQASGGIRNQQDIEKLGNLGVKAAIIGRALYESDFELSGIGKGETTC